MHDTCDIVVVGELNADLIVRGNVTPAFGQVEQLVDEARLTLGSSGAIFACGAARLGLRVAYVGVVGDDLLGHFVRAELQARHVDVAGVVIDAGLPTGLSIILSRPDDRAILTHAGSISALRYEQIDLRLLARARHLHLSSYFLLDALRPDVPRLFDDAHAAGLSVSLDPNYDPRGTWGDGMPALLARTDLFLPNEAEACAIAGAANADAALDRLAAQAGLVAVKRGGDGAVARRGEHYAHIAAPSVAAVDATGAGDSFDAGFVYGYLAGWDLERALRLGCSCGALSTRAAGGTAAQPTLAEALALLENSAW